MVCVYTREHVGVVLQNKNTCISGVHSRTFMYTRYVVVLHSSTFMNCVQSKSEIDKKKFVFFPKLKQSHQLYYIHHFNDTLAHARNNVHWHYMHVCTHTYTHFSLNILNTIHCCSLLVCILATAAASIHVSLLVGTAQHILLLPRCCIFL